MLVRELLMEKTLPSPLPEIVFGSADTTLSKAIGRAVKAGKLRKLIKRVYTSNMQDSLEDIVARNRYFILSKLFPNAVLSYRTAFEISPTKNGVLFLTYRYTKKISLPGLIINLVKGPGPIERDTLFLGKLHLASRPRAYLENMQKSRERDGIIKTLGKEEIEGQLEKLCQIHGQKELNQLRDQARKIAKSLQWVKEFKALDQLIGAILGTHSIAILQTERGHARARKEPYDQHRVELFAHLAAILKTQPLEKRENTATASIALKNLAFFESYFSNYIEGTEFLIEEAADIIFNYKSIPGRSDDAHDIIGTYRMVSNIKEMQKVPISIQQLIQLLQERHSILMQSRFDKAPRRFKEKTNRAGETIFVAPELVMGTLKKGFEFYEQLDIGIKRAMFIMFLITETHPFNDGNGRIARVMMNAELAKCEEMRIIVPTVYREDYLLALRCLSRLQDANPYVRMLDRAQRFTASIDFSNYEKALLVLRKSNAFLEPHEAKLNIEGD